MKKTAILIATVGACATVASISIAWWCASHAAETEKQDPTIAAEAKANGTRYPFTYEVAQDYLAVPHVQPKKPQLPKLPLPNRAEDLPRYLLNASKQPAVPEGVGKIIIVIDDVGVVEEGAEMALTLPEAVTLSFLPYGDFTTKTVMQARILGHEVMIHLPMEPKMHDDGYQADPGPKALRLGMKLDTVKDITRANVIPLADLAVGVNNHMGSAFTEWKEGMEAVLNVVQSERLFFMDSITTAKSAVDDAAKGMSLPVLHRNVFLDHIQTKEFIESALKKTETMAREKGFAVAIGHPHPITIKTINAWAKTLDTSQVMLAPVSALLTEPEARHER